MRHHCVDGTRWVALALANADSECASYEALRSTACGQRVQRASVGSARHGTSWHYLQGSLSDWFTRTCSWPCRTLPASESSWRRRCHSPPLICLGRLVIIRRTRKRFVSSRPSFKAIERSTLNLDKHFVKCNSVGCRPRYPAHGGRPFTSCADSPTYYH